LMLTRISFDVSGFDLCTFECSVCERPQFSKNKSIVAGTFTGWLYLLFVQYWTHDNWWTP